MVKKHLHKIQIEFLLEADEPDSTRINQTVLEYMGEFCHKLEEDKMSPMILTCVTTELK